MSDKRYEANIIRATAVEPANNLETTSAPGVWSLDEVVELQKKNKWPTAGRVSTDVDEVFSTYLYTGTGAQQTINNGLDLLNEGGLVWHKARTAATNNDHSLFDSETFTGSTFPVVQRAWESNVAGSLATRQPGFTFTSTGFTTTSSGRSDSSGIDYVTWSFRRAPKFFDVVNYTGDGNTSKTISHNLGVVPAMMIVLGEATGDYWVYHKDIGNTKYLELNKTTASQTSSTAWNNTSPTDTQFTVGNATSVNYLNSQYTVYLFAHNNSDGEFGPNGDQDIIKCGSFTNSGSGVEVDLGFEPQFMMFKRTDSTGNWCVVDEIRSSPTPVTTAGDNSNQLRWNLSNAENAEYNPFPTATGFKVVGAAGGGGGGSGTFVYMAIRRGPLAQPTAGTQVFDVKLNKAAGLPGWISSTGRVDFAIRKYDYTAAGDIYIESRLQGSKAMISNKTDSESYSPKGWDYNNGYTYSTATSAVADYAAWMWKRAPGYFDVVAYSGNGVVDPGQQLNHNLGVAPEMIWVKNRLSANSWECWFNGFTTDEYIRLDKTNGKSTNSSYPRFPVLPTETTFNVGGGASANGSANIYIAYLFATLAGVSKVGSYTGTGSDGNQIDCGFSSGARFVLIKRTDSSGDWTFFDSARGIVAGNDPYLRLNLDSVQESGYDVLDPYAAGFTVNNQASLNLLNASYTFYAIA